MCCGFCELRAQRHRYGKCDSPAGQQASCDIELYLGAWLQTVRLRSWLLRGQPAANGCARHCSGVHLGRWDCIKSGKMAKFGLGKVIVASVAAAIASFTCFDFLTVRRSLAHPAESLPWITDLP